jgi:hypothetical protein
VIYLIGILGFVGLVVGIWGLVKGQVGPLVGRDKSAAVAVFGLIVFLAVRGLTGSDEAPLPAPSAAQPATSTKAVDTKPAPVPAEPATAPKPAPVTPPETPPDKFDEWLTWMITKETGAQSNLTGKPARIRTNGIEFQPLSTGGQMVSIRLWADDNLTNNLIRVGIQADSTKIFKRIFTERQDAPDRVLIQWYFPGQDVKGNDVDLALTTVALTKQNAATFNWKNFTYSNLPKAADQYGEHPALSK